MPSEPLSYDSLKTVLQHMEANLRFQVSLQIPSIRSAERAVPLKINELTFDNMTTVVNETEYNLGIQKKYHDSTAYIPKDVQCNNNYYGYQQDFDQYGVRDCSSDHLMTPGDVAIGKPYRDGLAPAGRMSEIEVQRFEWQVEQFERVVAQARLLGKQFIQTRNPIIRNDAGLPDQQINVQEQEPDHALDDQDNARNVQEVDNHLVVGPQGQDIFNQENNEQAWHYWYFPRGTPVSLVESRIKDARAQLLPYHCLRDNRQPPFDMLIQFTETSPSGKQFYRMIYNKKLHEARKHLNSFLFGNRLFPIQVGWLKIADFRIRKTLRLPLGLRVKIRSLKISYKIAETYEALKTILEPSSLPLDCLHIKTKQRVDEDFKHPIITSAKKLKIWSDGLPAWPTVVQSLPNRKIHLQTYISNFEGYISLIQNWLDTGRQIDTHFSLEFNKEKKEITDLLESIKQQFNGAISGERSVTLPMSDSLDLKIFYTADPVRNVSELPFFNHPQCVLEMKVVRNESQ